MMGRAYRFPLALLGALNMVVSSTSGQQSTPGQSESVITFDGKKYALDSLSQEARELVRGVRVADSQLRFHEDTLKVIAMGRQAMAMKLKATLTTAREINS